MASIHNRAVLVGLRVSSWSAKKYDRKVSEETAAAHGADSSAGRYNKNLLPATVKAQKVVERKRKTKKGGESKKTETITIETNSHKELMAHIAATRQWLYDQTLAWDDNGRRMLPMANYQPVADGMRERKHRYESLYRDFIRDYPQLVIDARRILNGMFKEEDYPEDISKKFAWEFEVEDVPETDFRVSLPSDEIKALTAIAEARIQSRVESAQNDAVIRLFECVEKIHSKLADKRISERKRTIKQPVMKEVGTDEATGEPIFEPVKEQVGTKEVERRVLVDGKPVVKERVKQQVGTDEKTGKPIYKTSTIYETHMVTVPVFETVYETIVKNFEVETTEVFRDTLITNARELCDVLTRLNVADDARLEKFRRETEKLAQVEPEDIRNDAHAAQRTAEKAKSILDAMTATFGKNLFGGN